jgi:hypothetical protein
MIHTYQTARAFRAALEDRINRLAREGGIDHRRLRNQVAFERLLARLFAEQPTPPPWLLKGGFAFELRLGQRARATRDLDLAIPAPAQIAPPDEHQLEEIVEVLQQAANRPLGDWFVYQLSEPLKELTTPPYGGATLLVTVLLDQRVFARFHLDVGLGDVLVGAPDWMEASNLLAFAGIAPARVAVLPPAQQFAEKVHAYTLPHDKQESSRTKDLVDLVLLMELGLPEVEQIQLALRATFARRQTHPLPTALPPPPAAWRTPYHQLAEACGLRLATMEEGYSALVEYWQTLALNPETDQANNEQP